MEEMLASKVDRSSWLLAVQQVLFWIVSGGLLHSKIVASNSGKVVGLAGMGDGVIIIKSNALGSKPGKVGREESAETRGVCRLHTYGHR